MKRLIEQSIFTFFLFATLVACKENTEKKEITRPVKVQKPIQMSSADNNIYLPASINESRETKLSFGVGGPLIWLNDVTGSYVKEGDVIAKLDPRDFKIAVESTEAAYKLAKTEFERYKKLYEKASVSKSVFDKIETNYTLAKTNYEKAQNAFQDAVILAPFSGYINHVFVSNYETIAPGIPIISLLDVSKYEVNAWISLKDAASINKNSEYTCIIRQGEENIRIDGKLKEIGNKTSISKQSLPITVIINSSDDISLKAGMTTYLEINNSIDHTSASFLIPTSSVFTNDNKTFVWIFDEKSSTVSAKKIKTGKLTDNGSVEITHGLTGNEKIVTAGATYLFEGQKVKKMEDFSISNVGNKL